MTDIWETAVGVGIDQYVPRVGAVFARFLLQDSGCHAYGIARDGERWFLKGSVEEWAVPSLERAAALHERVAHPAIVRMRRRIATPTGLILVYPWVDGEVLYAGGGRARRLRADGPHARFRSLHRSEALAAVDAVLDAHVAVTDAGFVAVDLYDGCFIYDFAARRLWLCDLDEYRPGGFSVEGDRLPGSTRFMAPEEFRHGATIDERTTVFALGRAAMVLLDAGEIGERFRGATSMTAVLERATRPAPDDRHQSVRELVTDWRAAVRETAR